MIHAQGTGQAWNEGGVTQTEGQQRERVIGKGFVKEAAGCCVGQVDREWEGPSKGRGISSNFRKQTGF